LRGTRGRADPRTCRIRALARVEAEVGNEPGRLSQRNGRRIVGPSFVGYGNEGQSSSRDIVAP